MIGVQIISVLFLFTAASGQRHGEYSLTPVTVELDDIVMSILDELAPYVNESNCKLELVKIFETLIPVDNVTNYMFNIEIFCPDNRRSRVCTNVKVKKPTDCSGKSCPRLVDPKEIECITILTGENNYGNYSLTPVTIEIRKVVLEILSTLALIVQEPQCKFELLNIFSAVAQDARDVTNYMFDIEVYCPSSNVSTVCANVKVFQQHETGIVGFNDPAKIQCFTIQTGQDNSAYDSYNIAPFTIGMNKTLLKVVHQLSRAIDEPGCELEFVKVFEVLVQNFDYFRRVANLYMFDIEVYCPRNKVSKVCTNVKVLELNRLVRLIDRRGIQCYTIKTGKNSPVLDNYSLTPITIEIRKVVLEILGQLAPIVDEPRCKLELVDIFVAVAKVTPFVTEYMFDINVYCPSSKVTKVCVNVIAYESNVCIEHNITCPIIYDPEGIQCFEIKTGKEDHSIISQDSTTTPLPQFIPNTSDIGLNDGSGHDYYGVFFEYE